MITYNPHHSASYVIAKQCYGAAFTMINLYIVVKEIAKRRREPPKFHTYSLKWLSLLCITGGFLHAFTFMMHYFDGFCFIMYPFHNYIGKVLPICVGFYQLCRLYQCFADKNVSGGYPKWLFYAMGTFGILYLMVMAPVSVLNYLYSACGFDKNYEFERERIGGWPYKTLATFYIIATTLYLIWDCTTLLLFVTKLRSVIQSTTRDSGSMILSIRRNMMRIIILTLLYQLTQAIDTILIFNKYYHGLTGTLVAHLSTVAFLLLTTTMSYSVFLMEPHNSMEYGLFLKRMICIKFHFCCCCYRHDVVAQRRYFLQDPNHGVPLVAQEKHRRETSSVPTTAFNKFSMDAPLSAKRYQPPTVSVAMTGRPHVATAGAVRSVAQDDVRNFARERITSNDFLFESASNGFNFGVYLEYWRHNRSNTVLPKYSSLKEELTNNRFATITKEQYEGLQRQCEELKGHLRMTAKNIGIMNEDCGIVAGSEMTVEHIICIKFYTNFTVHQTIFKKHCRRLYMEEPLESVMERNSEIAHWCRLLRESIMFFGESMAESEVVYCGLNACLIFKSLHQRFECPLSTSKQMAVAERFAKNEQTGEHGVVLLLKRANPKTRYLNVVPFTAYQSEDERLFMGSTLKIVDIVVNNTSLKKYISALQLLEQIMRGQFLQSKKQTRKLLCSLLGRVNDRGTRENGVDDEIQLVRTSNALRIEGA